MNDEQKRLSVLEIEVKNMKNDLSEFKERSGEIHSIVHDLNVRITKQNGKIPYMSEKIDYVVEKIDVIADRQHKDELKNAYNDAKIKVLWAVAFALGTGLAISLLRYFLN